MINASWRHETFANEKKKDNGAEIFPDTQAYRSCTVCQDSTVVRAGAFPPDRAADEEMKDRRKERKEERIAAVAGTASVRLQPERLTRKHTQLAGPWCV